MKKDGIDFPGQRICRSQIQQLSADFSPAPFQPGRPFFQFNTDDRFLIPLRTNSHKSTPEYGRMAVKNGFAGNGKHGRIMRICKHPMGFSPAKPESTFFIFPPHISHTVPESISILDFRKGIVLGSLVIFACNQSSADHDLTDFPIFYLKIVRPS